MKELAKKIIISIVFLCLFQFTTSHILQATGKHIKIVVVRSKDQSQYNEAYDGFVEVLREVGISFQAKMYSLDKIIRPIEEIVDEIGYEKPDLILTIGTTAAREISQRISDLPIVFSMVLNPKAQGFIQNADHTVKNLSGVCLDIPLETQFQILKQSQLHLKRIAVLYHPTGDSVLIGQAERIAQKFGIKLVTGKINSENEILSILKNIGNKSDILWLIPNPYTMSYSSLKYILNFCFSSNFPIIGLSEFHVKAGALLALRADYCDNGRQTGDLVVEIIRRDSLADQVIISPRKIQLFVNKRTAAKMGIKLPTAILKQVERIYE
ncbi:MAG: ABC transporter substrate-binding protein [bacterium]|nr:MAG: ABC transporter substrate-binding protein [bacterium]